MQAFNKKAKLLQVIASLIQKQIYKTNNPVKNIYIVYNLYTDNINNLNKLKPYTTQYKFQFLVIDGLSIFNSNNLGPTNSSSFTYIDKVTPVKSKNLVLN